MSVNRVVPTNPVLPPPNGHFPKDYRENLIERRALLIKAKKDPLFREKAKTLFFRDPLFAFNMFFFTLDPRRRPLQHQPFCTYPYQDEVILSLVEHIQTGKDVVGEKSRDMGWSWMVILVFEWFWLNPTGGADFLLGSRIEDYVDKKGDMRTLLEKARYNLYRLPKWLRPKGFKPKTHDNFMRLQNPETGSSITGESNNANWSTGGRYLAALLDEFAKWKDTDVSAWTAAADATPCRIPLSTPFGAGGKYYEVVTDGKIDKITTHWSLHPKKAAGLYCTYPKPEEADETVDSFHWVGLRSPWYDSECLRRRPLEVMQELDIDYIGSGNPVFDGKAGKRLGTLLRSPKVPIASYRPLLDLHDLEFVADPGEEDGLLSVFELPNARKSYLLACDVAEGKIDGDFSVVKVLCRDTESIAASYAGRVSEVDIAWILKWIQNYYSFVLSDEEDRIPWWIVETNGPGMATFDLCVELHDMENAFMMPSFDTAREQISFKKGWWTTTNSKRILVSKVRQWLLASVGWTDSRCVKELLTFVQDGIHWQAKTGCFDDEVMTFGMLLAANESIPWDDAPVTLPTREDFMASVVDTPRIPIPENIQDLCLACAMRSQEERQSVELLVQESEQRVELFEQFFG